MNLQEARPFVAHFASGDYTPEGHEAFLNWLENASLEELDMIAREYETLQDQWTLPEGPSPEWIRQLEEKLDKMDGEDRLITVMRPRRRFMWVAAASVAVLAGGAWLWYGAGAVQQNVVSVARGEVKEIMLADGSKITLNSASTLRYPQTFKGRERVVELTGEAYFEIAENASMPFHVKAGALNIDVLGTRFNVMAYEDEGVVKATLVDGSVKVSNGSQSVILNPGDEVATAGAGLNVIHGAELQYVLAWKNGFLNFNNANLQSVMRAIGRCYNVEIQYEGKVPDKSFTGKLPRNNGLSVVSQILESQQIHNRIAGKTMIVRP